MMKLLRNTLAALAVATFALPATAQKYVGGDISLLPQYENANATYFTHSGTAISNALSFFRDEGWNAMRVRLFVDPSNYTNSDKANVCQDIEYVKTLGKRIKDAGFKFMLDFHYSDGWADPGKQWIPKAWTSLNDTQLGEQLYNYTKDALQQLKDAGAEPDLVQTGNEISYGMLWNRGSLTESSLWDDNIDKSSTIRQSVCWPSSSTSNWTRFTNLLEQATKATREVVPDAKIIIHVERVSTSQQNDNRNYAALKNFYQKITTANIDYDIIGLSYYPYFHGRLSELEGAINYLETTYPTKNIMVVETGYPYAWEVKGTTYDYTATYPYSDEGQKKFTDALVGMLNKHSAVNGLFWWWPEYNAHGTSLSGWYNAPLFDSRTGYATSALSSLKAFNNSSTGINSILSSKFKAQGSKYYNLQGQRISKPQHGVYIHQGKKIVGK